MNSPTLEHPNQNRKTRYVLLALAVLFAAMLIIKASVVPITFDEALTYGAYVQTHDYFKVEIANNHVLNTLLIAATASIAPYNVFLIRLPVLAACIVFVFILSFFLLKYCKHPIVLFIIILSPFYAFDFMYLARGYGLGYALNGLAVMLMLYAVDNHKKYWLLAVNLVIVLSVTANLMSVFVLAPYVVLMTFYLFFNNKPFWPLKMRSKQALLLAGLLLTNGALLWVFVAWGKSITVPHAAVYGGQDFWANLLDTFDVFFPYMVQKIVIGVLFLLTVFCLARRPSASQILLFILVVTSFGFAFLSNFFTEQDIYPTCREFLPFWPLVGFLLFNTVNKFDGFFNSTKRNSVGRLFLYACPAILVVCFALQANLKYPTPFWHENSYVAYEGMFKPYDPETCVKKSMTVRFYLKKYNLEFLESELNICR